MPDPKDTENDEDQPIGAHDDEPGGDGEDAEGMRRRWHREYEERQPPDETVADKIANWFGW